MRTLQTGDTLQATLQADLACAEKLCRQVEAFLEDRAPEADLFAAMLLVREAVNNAVVHGARQALSADVDVKVQADADRIVLLVRDHGPGFDWREALAKTPAPLSENGRGLPILKAYASSFRYNEAGNELTVILRRDQA
ncbi:MAG: ATP-binding protein [Desulfovibrionaceae bacterium]